MAGNIKHLFPGGNTSQGFYSFYNDLPPRSAKRIYVLKGGPGVGKSSIMKKIGEYYLNKNYDLEFHHCSSDNNSLDGLVIPSAGIAMLDGTAPHIVDPKKPGAIDEIVNLGEFWNELELVAKKEKIKSNTEEVTRLFYRAYDFLKASKPIYDDLVKQNSNITKFHHLNALTLEWQKCIFEDVTPTGKDAFSRHSFGSAYTPNGHVNYHESLLKGCNQVYTLCGPEGTGKSTVLKALNQQALLYGLNTEIYHMPLIPSKLEGIIIPELKTAIFTTEVDGIQSVQSINTEDLLNKDSVNYHPDEIRESKKLYQLMLSKAIQNIRQAKLVHDLLENAYIPAMNFEGINQKTKELIDTINFYL